MFVFRFFNRDRDSSDIEPRFMRSNRNWEHGRHETDSSRRYFGSASKDGDARQPRTSRLSAKERLGVAAHCERSPQRSSPRKKNKTENDSGEYKASIAKPLDWGTMVEMEEEEAALKQ